MLELCIWYFTWIFLMIRSFWCYYIYTFWLRHFDLLQKNDIGHNFWIIDIKVFILHMSISCDKIFLLLVSRYLVLVTLAIFGIGLMRINICVSKKTSWFCKQSIIITHIMCFRSLFFSTNLHQFSILMNWCLIIRSTDSDGRLVPLWLSPFFMNKKLVKSISLKW